MSHFKQIPVTLATLMLLLSVLGVAAVLVGVYLLAGLPVALIAGGAVAVAVGLLVDA